jgi:hypothetical protein
MATTNQKKVMKVWAAYEEARSAWTELYEEMREDFSFYESDQWSDAMKEQADRAKAPVLNLNYVKKTVDVINGFQRQNQTDIKAFPIENGDQKVAEVYSQLLKWILSVRNANHEISRAFKDMSICGIGWIAPELVFEDDIINGDIRIRKVDPFNMLIDPHFKEHDLSDAAYLIRHKIVSKEKLKQLFPNKKAEIDRASSKFVENEDLRQEIVVPSDQGKNAMVIEYWYKKITLKTFVIDTQNPSETTEFEGTKTQLDVMLSQNPNLRSIRRKVPEIRVTIVANDELLFDGLNPHDTKGFPFIPIFGYFETGNQHWKYRIQGLVRSLKDPQREKNHRRSMIMQVIGKMPQYGWVYDKGAVDDINVFKRKTSLIEKNPGREITQIRPTEVPAGVVTLEQLFDGDMNRIGANLDQIGLSSESGEAGVTISHRIRQGLMSNQELFDNLGFAKRQLGREIVRMLSRNYSRSKMQRILGDDIKFIPDGLEEQVKQAAQQAANMAFEAEKEKAALEKDIQALEDRGQDITEVGQQQLVAQLDAIDQQVIQAQNQAQALQTQLAIAIAERDDFWNRFEQTRKTARFDTSIDETGSNPTFRVGAMEALLRAMQYGASFIPPEAIINLMEVPVEVKKSMLQQADQLKQIQLQQLQLETQKEQNKFNLEITKQQGQRTIELIKQGINPKTGERMPEKKEEEKK